MSLKNWPGFPDDNKKVGEQYFTLSSIWPKNIPLDKIDDVIMNPIKDLFKKIISCGTKGHITRFKRLRFASSKLPSVTFFYPQNFRRIFMPY